MIVPTKCDTACVDPLWCIERDQCKREDQPQPAGRDTAADAVWCEPPPSHNPDGSQLKRMTDQIESRVRQTVDSVNALAREVQLRSWWGLGTQTEEVSFPGYTRQQVSQTEDVVFRDVPVDVTHLQLWEKKTGGGMLFYSAIKHTVGAGDAITIRPDVLPVDCLH